MNLIEQQQQQHSFSELLCGVYHDLKEDRKLMVAFTLFSVGIVE